MTVATCHRCEGNSFLEQLSPGETAWVCLQCGSRRYVRQEELEIDGTLRRFAR